MLLLKGVKVIAQKMAVSFASLAFGEEKDRNERKWGHWGLGVDKEKIQ